MAKIKIWPHEELCPNGANIESLPDETICEAALREGIKIEHPVRCPALVQLVIALLERVLIV